MLLGMVFSSRSSHLLPPHRLLCPHLLFRNWILIVSHSPLSIPRTYFLLLLLFVDQRTWLVDGSLNTGHCMEQVEEQSDDWDEAGTRDRVTSSVDVDGVVACDDEVAVDEEPVEQEDSKQEDEDAGVDETVHASDDNCPDRTHWIRIHCHTVQDTVADVVDVAAVWQEFPR